MRMHTDPKSGADLGGHFVDEMTRDSSGSTNGLAGRLGTSNCWSELFRRPIASRVALLLCNCSRFI